MRRILFFCLKLSLILAIFVFLFWQAGKNDAFTILFEQSKRWDLIGAAFLVQCFAVSVTFVRWRMLAKGLGLTFSIKEAFRLGFLGLMLNLAPMGLVGGDAIKAVLLAKQNPARRAIAVASVIVDRIIGLLVMFLLGAILVYMTGFAFRPEVLSQTFTQLVFALTIVGFVSVGIVFLPFFSKGHVERQLEKLPFVGHTIAKLVKALLLYRDHKVLLIQAFLLTLFVHVPFGIALYLIARGLFGSVPGLIDHVLLYCVTNLTAMIPLAAGPFELVLDNLYPLFTDAHHRAMGVGIGLVVALGHRLVSICVAAIGIAFYLTSKQEIEAAQHAEEGHSVSEI